MALSCFVQQLPCRPGPLISELALEASERFSQKKHMPHGMFPVFLRGLEFRIK